MVKKATNRASLLLGVSIILMLCMAASFPIKAKAIETDPANWPKYTEYFKTYDYFMGTTVDSFTETDTAHSYKWGKDNNSHFFVTIQTYGKPVGEIVFENGNSVGHDYQYITKKDFKCKYDKKTRIYTYTCSVTFNTGGGIIGILNYSDLPYRYTLCVTSEPEIVLSKTAISEITNTKQRTMTVKYAPVRKRLGYQIEYSTDNKFKDKQRVNTGATTKDVGKLTKGKTYYVRVRTYARYNDGSLVYSKWSGTKKIKITK